MEHRAKQNLASSTSWLHLFGDQTRLRLMALLEQHELSVADLTSITQLSQSRVSTHLGKLREAGVLHDRRAGNSTRYRMHRAMPQPAAALWGMLRSQLDDESLEADASRCRSLLAGHDGWPDSVAGQMERHYSPGRTWEALVHGLSGLLELGDVLDVGCGDGWSARLLAPQCRTYVGLDRSEAVVDAAKARTSKIAHATIELGDAHALPFDDESFDHVLLFHVLTYAKEPREVWREAGRVLRTGGRMVVVTLAEHEFLDATSAYGHIHGGFSPRRLRAHAKAAGLTLSRCNVTSRERRKPHYEVITAVAHKRLAEKKGQR